MPPQIVLRLPELLRTLEKGVRRVNSKIGLESLSSFHAATPKTPVDEQLR
jgi:hypothetical protein